VRAAVSTLLVGGPRVASPDDDLRAGRTHDRFEEQSACLKCTAFRIPLSRVVESNAPNMSSPIPNPSLLIDRFVGEYRFLSNFFPCDVTTDAGLTYASVEHAYQAAKATTEEERLAIAGASSPKKAKHRGSKLTPSPDWSSRKVEVMRSLLRRKFASGTELAAKLVATGDAELIEGKRLGDEFWGRCNGVGQNHLGRLLMETRDSLRGPCRSPEDRPAV